MALTSLKWKVSLFCGVFLLSLTTGCHKNDSPIRYNVAGHVTFAGKPLPKGTILFSPDGDKGKDNVAGFAAITNGEYDTIAGGKGVIGGPHVVRISGFDGIHVAELPNGKPLFPDYQTKADLPKEKTVFSVDVPMPATKGPRARH